ncbi:MAG TPA: extracellular solute-binding protein [Stellaceae bacterium]|nr:extracellular solute-binding protein [Stellaceae bacterium]
MRVAALALTILLAAGAAATDAADVTKSDGLSLFGDLKYGADFSHFDYVNPDAPKGGTVRYSSIGTFDNLNFFILKGNAAAGLGGLFDTLMFPAGDEPASAYGLVAESVEVPADRSWVQYNLRKEARFQDGSPITPEDVIWTFETLKEKGHPRYRLYYADVMKAEKVGARSVKFSFRTGNNRELPQIVGEMPVLSKAYWSTRDFEKTTLEAPLGSGPYKVESFDVGRTITYRRVADYWGKDLPVNRGRNNFDVIRYDYYRDQTVALEAFKAGNYDIRVENVAKNWATGYDSPAFRDGLFKKEEIPNKVPAGMQGFGFNTRKDLFKDPRVRQALSYLFDFEWTNKNLFYDAYTRTESYFSNSELASSGLPSSDELKILEKYKGQIPDEVYTKAYEPPKTDGSGNLRDNMRQALRLLKEAGWSVKGEKLVNDAGQVFTFEFLLDQPEFERIVLPFVQNLGRIGITASIRKIDPAQYENRMKTFDYDMTVVAFGESLSPGNEQRDFWSSAAADEPGGQNYLGVKSKAVDDLVDLIINAPDRPSLVTRVHALDRVLLHGYYVIPNWHLSYFRVAAWDKFLRPKISPSYALAVDTWWIDPEREQTVEAKKAQEAKP